MDKIPNEELNTGKTEYCLTEQMNTGSKLCKPPLEQSEDGLLCVHGAKSGEWEAEGREQRAESPEGNLLPIEMLKDGARELGIELSDDQLWQLDRFAQLLVKANKTLNLTRITDPTEIVVSHYLDSFTCLAAVKIKPNARVIDIGTGAGFPGVPVKIVRSDLDVTLLDSAAKKLKFVESALCELAESSKQRAESPEGGPISCRLVHARAEEAGRDSAHREHYDVAFARALADMKVLAELALPLVKVGGILIAQKSEGADEEIDAARPLIGQLGGRIENIRRIAIPSTDIIRQLVVIIKAKPTPPQFPRPYAQITRKTAGS